MTQDASDKIEELHYIILAVPKEIATTSTSQK